MNNERYLWELQRTLSAEFTKYVLSHPEIDKQIPNNAQIIFHLKDNTEFNRWNDLVALRQREPGQPVIIVEIDELAPSSESRLVNPRLELAPK